MADVINVNRIYMTTAKKESRDNERSFETWKTETKEKTLPFVVSGGGGVFLLLLLMMLCA